MTQPKGPVGALFAGRVDDGGFMESGYKGFLRARDWHDGRFPAGEIRRIGLENPEAVRLTLAATVPADAAARIKTLQDDIIAGRLRVTETYDGPEFNV